ncbi:30S ribosomal protein S12 methylthiotransferase RimO [Candidatus Peregrinibacteria bacterium]|nr:30S ribosomal protein S12 methylthiotransferase RimO [Candidatus Peregrinibacteria bacterium]
MNIGVISLGCHKNTADTETILARLPLKACLVNVEDAEIVLLNSCAFLKAARDEIYDHLKKLKDKKVILLGCMAGSLTQDIFKTYPQLYAVVSGARYGDIARIIETVAQDKKIFAVSAEPAIYVDLPGKFLITPRSYAYVKIAEGCDNACSFCLIPKLKGAYRSRPKEAILEEVKNLLKRGVKELILVAQDTGYYGVDLYRKKSLADLLKAIVALPGDFWVRVLYFYPERVDDELLETFANSPKICRYLDMPLQHGDPAILKQMRRPYDTKKILEKISAIRQKMPDMTFRTSLIVGFPGETEKAFKNLLHFISIIRFDNVGVFEYSREPGTKAFDLTPQITNDVKQQRREQVMLLQQKICLKKHQAMVGTTHKTLIEAYDPVKKTYQGRPMRFAPDIDGLVHVSSKKKLELNQFYEIKVTKAEPYEMEGEVRITYSIR